MNKYFLATVRYDKVSERGVKLDASETYLVNALSFTECEKKLTEGVGAYTTGAFAVLAEKRSNIQKLLGDSGEKFYHCKVNVVTIDERTGKEKKIAQYYLVNTDSIDEARKIIEEQFSMNDFEIEKIAEMKIVDVL